MPRIYRVMTREEDGKPRTGATARSLGVRVPPNPNADVVLDEAGNVGPDSGGMSVAPAWRDLPRYRIPSRLRDEKPGARGKDDDACFCMGEGPFEASAVTDDLVLHPDEPQSGESVVHGVVAAAAVFAVERFQRLLFADTRQRWTIDEE